MAKRAPSGGDDLRSKNSVKVTQAEALVVVVTVGRNELNICA